LIILIILREEHRLCILSSSRTCSPFGAYSSYSCIPIGCHAPYEVVPFLQVKFLKNRTIQHCLPNEIEKKTIAK
jgi:hypothetical protein